MSVHDYSEDQLVEQPAMSIEAANREDYQLLKEGIPVSIPDREHSGQQTTRLKPTAANTIPYPPNSFTFRSDPHELPCLT
jgi:hypothetical protein